MFAAIDVGTNTVRLLLGCVSSGQVVPDKYFRKITRLGGKYCAEKGLAPDAMERTLSALKEMAQILETQKLDGIRAVGTEVLRKAVNGQIFVDRVRKETGIPLEVITGQEEAWLSTQGVLAALNPKPRRCLVFDIGGGSTEFSLLDKNNILFSQSYPLGVVGLCENHQLESQGKKIRENIFQLANDLEQKGLQDLPLTSGCVLVGTAGTVTTLAALKLKMSVYDWRRVNNTVLYSDELKTMLERLETLSIPDREALPGMEKGRADLILPGLRVVLAIMDQFEKEQLTVSDFGLLEGALLAM